MESSFVSAYANTFVEAMKYYFIFCGSAFLLFHVLLRRRLARRKITQKPIRADAPLKEIGRTMISSLVGKGPLVLLIAYLVHQGLIPEKLIYTDVSDYGWAYFVLTIVVDILVFDIWFYISHRFFLHSRFIYRRIHIVHHRSVDPTPFARNSVHPIEGIFNGIFHVLPVFLLPHHLAAILISTQLKGMVGILGHLGYEVFWSGFTRSKVGRYIVTPVHHHLHHSKNVRTNFSFLINWDRIFGTLSSDYHDAFEATVNRARPEERLLTK